MHERRGMPSKAIRPAFQQTAEMQLSCWTDALPKCKESGYGNSENKAYQDNENLYTEHPMEDFCINLCLDGDKTSIYGIFDGHDGSNAARFASQRMPAELGFEQLSGRNSEEEVTSALSQAFLSVENSFMESIDPHIAERVQLLEKIPPELSPYEASQKFPDTFSRLQVLEEDIRGGTACAVALVHKNILYVGNVGNTRVLLCKEDKGGVLKVIQLSVDHTTSSADELQRLAGLSVDAELIKGRRLQGNHDLTRCIGNYFLKGGYKESSILDSAIAEPIIAQPYITSRPLDRSCKLMLIMSEGLYTSFAEATGSTHVNRDIASRVLEEMRRQSTLKSVAQTVVDNLVRNHHDMFLTQNKTIKRREDMSLLVRNFNCQFPCERVPLPSVNYPLANVVNDTNENPLPGYGSIDDLSEFLSSCDFTTETDGPTRNFFASAQNPPSNQESHSNPPQYNTTSTESSKISNPSLTQLTLDERGCVNSYVDFGIFYASLEEAVNNKTLTSSELALLRPS